MPSSFVFEEFRADKIEQIVARQAEMAKKGQATHTVIVCDDCMCAAAPCPSRLKLQNS